MTHMLGRKVTLGGYVALTALTLSFMAQGAAGQTRAQFELFANCEPMDLVVENLPPDAAEIGLTVERIEAAVESRLRSARLFDSDSVQYLYVNVNVVGRAFHSSVEYKKRVFDYYSNGAFYASTWDIAFTGTHGKDGGYILAGVSELMDVFLVEYLRVNEEACAKR